MDDFQAKMKNAPTHPKIKAFLDYHLGNRSKKDCTLESGHLQYYDYRPF